MDPLNDLLNSASDFESYEDFENLVQAAERGNKQAIRKLATKAKVAIAKNPVGGNERYVRQDSGNSVGSFSLIITRNTRTIAQTLPVCLFMPEQLENGYRETLAPFIPSGFTLSVTYGTNVSATLSNRVRFSYTDGVNTDTIDVTCNMTNYLAFLSASKVNRYQLTNLRMQVSETASANLQFNEQISAVRTTLFGKQETNRIPLPGMFTPDQFQSAIIDIREDIVIQSNSGLVVPVVRWAADAQTISFTGFVSEYVRF